MIEAKKQTADGPFLVRQVVGDVAPQGEAVRLTVECEGQGPFAICLRSEDVKYLVSLLLNLGCEARRRQTSDVGPVSPQEAIPLPLDAIDIGQSDDGRSFMLLEVGLASLMFVLSPKSLEEVGQMMLLLSGSSSVTPS